jgi:hypothetical protein
MTVAYVCSHFRALTHTHLSEHLSRGVKALVGSCTSFINVKRKAIPVTGRDGPYGYETSRLPHFLDSRLTDGGEVVSLTRRPPFTRRKIPGTHFC